MATRTDHDSLGPIEVPEGAYWGAQTQRAIEHFDISGLRLPPSFVRSQAIVKRACAKANVELGNLDPAVGGAIVAACDEILAGQWLDQFVVDVYQAGAGTSQNMNANEVIANRAAEILGGRKGDVDRVHPNDHVNRGQSTNDTIPTAIHMAVREEVLARLLPAAADLRGALARKAIAFDGVLKSGRTHLQDAVPMRLGQEFGAYARMIELGEARVAAAAEDLRELAIGGNAVGTGINTPPRFRERAVAYINEAMPLGFRPADNAFEAIQNRDAVVHLSGALRTLATSLVKIADDVRLLCSGPLTGFDEITLPVVQPGSSIMPGKVNPVMAEMLDMVCFQVMGHDATIVRAGQAGQLELNVMMPVIAYNALQAVHILSRGIAAFTAFGVSGIEANVDKCLSYAERTPQVATALSPHIGYEKAAAIVKQALAEGRSVREVMEESGLVPKEKLDEVLDLRRLT